MVVLQRPLLYDGWGGHPMGLSHRPCDFTAQCSILSISLESLVFLFFFVRHFPEQSWTVVAFPCFTVLKSFRNWYALLLFLFVCVCVWCCCFFCCCCFFVFFPLRFSLISLHCCPIKFPFAFFTHPVMFLFTSPYFSDPSGLNRSFLSSLLLLHLNSAFRNCPSLRCQLLDTSIASDKSQT